MVRPGWPTRFPGFLGVWVDRMKAYVDAHTGTADSITGLISEGSNVTITGAGTPGDEYVISSTANAEPGTPVEMATEGVTPFGDNPPAATLNADGSVSLQGGFVYHGPAVAGGHNVMTLVPPYLPARIVQFGVAALLISGGGPVPAPASISITLGGTVQLLTSALAEGDLLEVVLDSVTYWPASA